MTWTERVKLAWITFKRVALPLYGWTLISIGGIVVLGYAMFMGLLDQFRWAFSQASGGSFSPRMPILGMPVPGIPTMPGIPPNGHFGSSQSPFGLNGGLFSNPFALLAVAGSLVGIFFLIFIVACLIGSLFSAGQFNLTAKAYREKVRFEDFRFSGFLRVFGWQVFLFLIYLIVFAIGLLAAFALGHSTIAMSAFFIIYGLLFIVIQIYTLPWVATSIYYVLAHREQRFSVALRGSWKFFRRHMGALWGYIGTVILIHIALLVLIKISGGLGYLATFAVNPFFAVLAIVWVLSLEDDERQMDVNPQINPTTPFVAPYPEAQTTIVDPPTSDSHATDTPALQSEEPKISLQKAEPLSPLSEDKP